MQRRTKYGVRNDKAGIEKRTNSRGEIFDSEKEREYGDFLDLGQVRYSRQQKHVIFDAYNSKYGKLRAIEYCSDFEIGNIVIDVKGFETSEFKMKKKMFAQKFPEKTLILARKRRGVWEHYVYSFPTKKKKIEPLTLEQVLEIYG